MPSHLQENPLGDGAADAMGSPRVNHGAGCRGRPVKDIHCRSVSRPLSLSCSPERPQPTPRGAVSSSVLSSKACNGAHISAVAGRDGEGAGASALPADRNRMSADLPGRGGCNATVSTSLNGRIATPSGSVITPIQVVPPGAELPPETLLALATVKSQRESHQQRVAARGAFSKVTSCAILQRVNALQLSARQVEPVGWAPIEPSPMSACAFDDSNAEADAAAAEDSGAPIQRRAASVGGEESAAQTAPTCARGGAARPRAVSSEPLMTSDAPAAAKPWKEDTAELPVSPAQQHVAEREPTAEQAVRLHALPLRPQRHPDRRKGNAGQAQAVTSTTLSPTRPCNGSSSQSKKEGQSRQHRHAATTIAPAPCSNSRRDATSFAMHSTASAERSPARSLSPNVSQRRSSADHPDGATACGPRKSSASLPRGFERFVEKGKRRRSEAERARRARAAEVAGEPLIAAPEQDRPKGDGGDTAPSTESGPTKRPRKVLAMPLPRGYEAYAQKGQALRAKANREAEKRRTDDVANCTHHPRVNRPSIVSTSAPGGAWAPPPALQSPPRSAAASEEGSAADAVRPLLSVWERLAAKGGPCNYGPRELEEGYAPSLQRHRLTLSAAAAGAQGGRRATAAGASSAADKHAPAQQAEETDVHPKKARGTGRHLLSDFSAHAHENVRAATAGSAPAKPTAPKKSQAGAEQHVAEGEGPWHRRIFLSPSTDELAKRARARYRMREELAKQQRSHSEAQRTEMVNEGRQRTASGRCTHPSLHPLKRSTQAGHAPRQGARSARTAAVVAAEKAGAAATLAHCAATDDFYAQQLRAEARKRRHLEQLRLERAKDALSECTFRPTLNSTSKRMAQRLVVESYHEAHADSVPGRSALVTARSEEVVAAGQSAGRGSQAAELCSTHKLSPSVMSRSGSLFRELGRASPLAHCHVPSPPVSRSRSAERGIDCRLGGSFTDHNNPSRAESFCSDLRAGEALGREAISLPSHASGPMVEQLRNLEDMLREWKAIERACSPMLKQFCKASATE
ncbi:hypothetical protein LSCM1_08020 [Leishmania martiniquensis]|uniref:Uncharacterized protein n=1 Tax=Leishmania martiniquensis TaxID=1580590 RepID=A0A836H6J1_9TRYP|nr:hypothetical protein LSCM1_08020 [Leishmania martiniquensis]